MHDDYERLVGQATPKPLHLIVNGWYYYSLNFLPASPRAVLRMLPGVLVRLPRDFRRIAPVFPPLARFGVDVYAREWRQDLLPAYGTAVARAEASLADASIEGLIGAIDDLATTAGHYFTSITFVAGYGWKTEIPLARFFRAHLATVRGHPQELLRGLVGQRTAAHSVTSLDWYFPTLGDIGVVSDRPSRADLAGSRAELEQRCRAALDVKTRARFDRLLAEAQRAAALREEQVRDLTLAWPFFRRALARIGEELRARGLIANEEDVYFLRREELDQRGDLAGAVAIRRAQWEGQRLLEAPLTLGKLPGMLVSLLDAADRAVRDPGERHGAVIGVPASPGHATGRVRVIRDASDFAKLQAGDVLVCRVTTPAWTTLFGIASAVVTDVGSVAAHASIIAREYGIPAVVGTGDGTSRLTDGMIVSVDGGAGTVTPRV